MTKAILKAAIYSASIALVIWAGISFFDVVNNNLTTGDYWQYNLFVMLSAMKA